MHFCIISISSAIIFSWKFILYVSWGFYYNFFFYSVQWTCKDGSTSSPAGEQRSPFKTMKPNVSPLLNDTVEPLKAAILSDIRSCRRASQQPAGVIAFACLWLKIDADPGSVCNCIISSMTKKAIVTVIINHSSSRHNDKTNRSNSAVEQVSAQPLYFLPKLTDDA